MTSDLDKISRKENKHIRALQCSDASRLGSHKMQRKASLVSQRDGSRSASCTASPVPSLSLRPLWARRCLPADEQPNPQTAPLALLQSEKSDTI